MSKVISLDPSDLEYRARERQRGRREVGERPVNLIKKKGDRDLEPEKTKETFLLEEQHENFVAAVRK